MSDDGSARPRAKLRLDLLLLDVVGVVAFVLGAYKTVQGFRGDMDFYDEGLILSHTRTLVWGGWPFRDFYTQYPPGIYFLLRALWKVFGTHVLVGRCLSIVVRLAGGAAAGLVGGRLAQRRYAVLPAGVVMLWLGMMRPLPWAWPVAVLCALGAVAALSWAWQADAPARGRLALAGGMLGGTLSFRHDLFVYFATALTVAAAVWIARRRIPARAVLRVSGWLAAGAAVPLAIFWLPTLVMAPWMTIYRDLYFDQVHYVLPARRLPLLSMTELVPIAHLPFRVPCFLASYDPMTFALIFAGPALAALLVVRALRRGPAAVDAAAAVSLGALALAVVPQALGRSDCHHALAALIPGALLVAALPYTFGPRAGRRWSPGTLAAALLVLAFFTRALKDRYPPEGPLFAPQGTVVSDGSPFTRGIASPHAEERRHLREYLSTLLKPGEAVFAGNRNHSLLAANDADLFFVLDRPSVTRYMQFDPGIITRAPVQREVIADLERKRPRVAILNSAHTWTEKENDSSKPGATLLDEYLNQHYHRVESFGTYEVHVRNP